MYLNGVQNKEVPMLMITPEVLKDLKNGNITVGLEHTRDKVLVTLMDGRGNTVNALIAGDYINSEIGIKQSDEIFTQMLTELK